jgi:hypothetical protein
MILSKTICEASDEANKKGFPENVAFSSNSPTKSSIIVLPLTPPPEVFDKATICGVLENKDVELLKIEESRKIITV